jgi:hypothetical protein
VDQIVFEIPADAPAGCYVPIQVRTGGQVTSNTVTIAIHTAAQQCSDPGNPLQPRFGPGGNFMVALFERARTVVDLEPEPSSEREIGLATVSTRKETGSPFFYNPLLSLPPVGSCAAWSVRGNVFAGGELPGIRPTGGSLNAGEPLQIQGASGVDFRSAQHYMDLRGSVLSFNAGSGSLVLSSPGGPDVAALNATVSFGDAIDWTNRSEISEIDRAVSLRLAWSTQAGASAVVVAGGNYDVAADASGAFLCLAPAGSSAFEVPSQVLSVVPASWTGAITPFGRLFVGAAPQGGVSEFQAVGLDRGLALFLQTLGKTVSFR